MVFCDNINKLEFAEGLTDFDGCCGVYFWKTKSSINELVYPSTASTIPISITDLAEMTSEGNGRIINRTYTIPCNKLVCKALIPPAIKDMSNYEYDFENKCYIYSGKDSNGMNFSIKHKMDISDDVILYVPSESIELYRNAPLWDCFNIIKAIEDM